MPRIAPPERMARLTAEQADVLRTLDLPSGELDVLDVGCADLRPYSEELIGMAGAYTGLEISAEALAGVAPEYRDLPHVTLVEGNAESMPFPDASFDLVTLHDMLAYTDRTKVLREAARVLRPGGTALSLHNNSAGWSLYKMRYPEKPALTEWAHSITVLLNTQLHTLTGRRAFRTTYNSRGNLMAAIKASGLTLERFWDTRGSYRWYHFILTKP